VHVVDVQEKLMPKIVDGAAIVGNIAYVLDAAALTNVTVLATEQYPKGLGPTVPELARRLPERPDKVTFSCCGVAGLVPELRRQQRSRVLLVGIEAHVCVLHTALDLLAEDFWVYLATDAVGSRCLADKEMALRRLEGAGAILTTVETAVFEWTRSAAHPNFKKISALVQQRMKTLEPRAAAYEGVVR
ncbi:MAG: isochorismatase family protein, partial [Gemmataceae bacterium]|nr:isochorismatase family protein [Gemmataceae bacterium]